MESWTFTLYFELESSSILLVKSFHLWPLQTVPGWLPAPFGMPTLFCFLKTPLLSGLTKCSKFICIISFPAIELPISPRNPGSLCWKMTFSNQDLDYTVFWKPFVFLLLILYSKSKPQGHPVPSFFFKEQLWLGKFLKIQTSGTHCWGLWLCSLQWGTNLWCWCWCCYVPI